MLLNELKDNAGARKGRMRVGRGIGSGKGKTCGRGGKGQTARTGVAINGFEGGQMPIYRRLPKRGFNNPHRTEYEVIGLDTIAQAITDKKLDGKKPITPEILRDAGLIRGNAKPLKILSGDKLSAKVTLHADKVSASAAEKVKQAGGEVILPSAS